MFAPHDAVPLPPRPSLDQYKKRAKELVKAANSPDTRALHAWARSWVDSLIRLSNLQITPTLPVRIESWIDHLDQFARAEKSSAKLSLTKAQFILARAHGFESWPKLCKHIAAIQIKTSPTSTFEQAADAVISGNLTVLESLVKRNPSLIRTRSTRQHQATLLHYVAANGVEGYRQKTPPNAVRIAQLLLDAGAYVNATSDVYGALATTLALIATSLHPEQAGLQVSLMELLLARGAKLDEPQLLSSCLANGRLRAAEFLAHRGAPEDLEAAAGLGHLNKVKSYFDQKGKLTRNATTGQFHRALLWAAEYGRNEVIAFLLDHGAPVTARSHDGQTPLHWAIIGGHVDTIKLLLARGADLQATNSYGGTPLGQARWSAAHAPKNVDYAPVIAALIQAGAKNE